MANLVKIYHGTDHQILTKDNKLNVLRMDQGNLQSGNGISFGSFVVASGYGSEIIYTEVDQDLFLHSRESFYDEIVRFHSEIGEPVDPIELFTDFLLDMHKLDTHSLKASKENSEISEDDIYDISLYNLVSDYIEINLEDLIEEMNSGNENSVARSAFESVMHSLLEDEVRNFQINISEQFNIVDFQKVWQKYLPTVIGTFDSNTDFYAILNDKDISFKNYAKKNTPKLKTAPKI